jgi:hypothetical protein
MVGHVVYGNQFVLLGGNNPGDKFAQFLTVFGPDQILSPLNGKYDMDINLRVGIGHAQKMPLLTELGNLFSGFTTNMPALTGLENRGSDELCHFTFPCKMDVE